MRISFTRSIGSLLLAIYLILLGLTGLVPTLAVPSIVFPVLALLAGVFILMGM